MDPKENNNYINILYNSINILSNIFSKIITIKDIVSMDIKNNIKFKKIQTNLHLIYPDKKDYKLISINQIFNFLLNNFNILDIIKYCLHHIDNPIINYNFIKIIITNPTRFKIYFCEIDFLKNQNKYNDSVGFINLLYLFVFWCIKTNNNYINIELNKDILNIKQLHYNYCMELYKSNYNYDLFLKNQYNDLINEEDFFLTIKN